MITVRTHKRQNSPLTTQWAFVSLHLEYSLSKSRVEGHKMTPAKWTSIPDHNTIYAILLQDLMKRGACRCGVEMLLRWTPLTTLVQTYIDDSGQCHFNNVESHICLKAHTVLKSRYLLLGTLHIYPVPSTFYEMGSIQCQRLKNICEYCTDYSYTSIMHIL
jgi:hypothetical protein